jgi:ABC-type branched-subunit amino acid transport system ATPase component
MTSGLYVSARAEELRDKFVDFKGKKEREIKVNGTMRTFQEWHIFPPWFLDLITETFGIKC